MISRKVPASSFISPIASPSFKGVNLSALESNLIKLGTNGGPVAATIASSVAIGTMRPLLLLKDKELKPEDKIYSAFWYAAVSGIALGLLLLYKKPLEDGLFKLSANLLKNQPIQKNYLILDEAKKGLKNVTKESLNVFHEAQKSFNNVAKQGNGNAVVGLSKIMTFVSNMAIMTTVATIITKYLKPLINTILPKKTGSKDAKKENLDNKIIKGPKDVAIMTAFASAVGLLSLSKFPAANAKMGQIFNSIASKFNNNNVAQSVKGAGKANPVLQGVGNLCKGTSNIVWTFSEVVVNGVSRFAILSSAKQTFSAISTGAGEGINALLIFIMSFPAKIIQKQSLKNNSVHKFLYEPGILGKEVAADIKEGIIKNLKDEGIKAYYVGEGQKMAIDMLITNFLTLGIISGLANNFVTKKLVSLFEKNKKVGKEAKEEKIAPKFPIPSIPLRPNETTTSVNSLSEQLSKIMQLKSNKSQSS